MKRLSEVCRIVGVTRRTLQEYDKIGLLSPTSKTDAGYWLYDDDAIQTLTGIQVFIEAGYKRKTIKALIEAPYSDFDDELDNLISDLEKKRKRIDGMINTMKLMKLYTKLPESAYTELNNFDVPLLLKGNSFKSFFENVVKLNSDNGESVHKYLYECFNYLLPIGFLVGEPESASHVQDYVDRAFDAFKNMVKKVISDKEDSKSDLTESELAKVFLEVIQEIAKSSNITQTIESIFGVDALPYIIRAIQVFSDNKKNTDLSDRKEPNR